MVTARRGRIAVVAMFVVNGALFGVWAARIPAFVERFALDEADLGRLLLCMAGGAILAFPMAGRLSDRIGAARATRLLALGYALTLPMLALAPSAVTLAVVLGLFGAFHGAMDVTMNAWASEVERALARPIMASFHGTWSLGAGLGALSGWLAVADGHGPGAHFLAAALVFGGPALWVALIPWQSARSTAKHGFALPPRALLLVGLVAFCASVGEGAMADWSALFLISVARANEATAALGYAVYSVAMVIARLSADRVIVRLGPVNAARLGGTLALAGVVLALAGQTLATGLSGFVLMGLGYSVMIPLAFSRAANQPGLPPGRAIAGVATLGYGGMLLGPVIIGAVSHATSLVTGFGVLAVLAAASVALARALTPDARA